MKRVKYQVWGLRTRAQAQAAMGDTAAARADLREALDLARPTTDPALLLLVAAALLEGEGDDALAREAHAAAQRIRAALPTDALRSRFDAAAPVREIARLVG